MHTTEAIATHLRELHFGGNWTDVNLHDTLNDITWEEAIVQVKDLNTIAKLTYHINYYIAGQLRVLEGGPLDIRDKFAFDLPEITSDQDWQKLLEKAWADARRCADLIATLPNEKLSEPFVEEKYGTYFKNFIGLIEHSHYHLGQIVLIKKLIRSSNNY